MCSQLRREAGSSGRDNSEGKRQVDSLEGANEKLEQHVDVLAARVLVLPWLSAIRKGDLEVLRHAFRSRVRVSAVRTER
jgi:hypothetical protein